VLADELRQFEGCRDVQTQGTSAVAFACSSLEGALRVLLWTRTAHKVMEMLCTSSSGPLIRDRDDLADFIRTSVDVQDLLGDGRGNLLTLSVSVLLNQPRHIPADINHSHYTALTVKNALCDSVRELHPDKIRPSVDLEDPDVPIVVAVHGIDGNADNRNGRGGAAANGATAGVTAEVSVYRQLHCGSLHKRGYRSSGNVGNSVDEGDNGGNNGGAIHKAAMKESLAAGLLRLSGWHELCRKQQEHRLSQQVRNEDAHDDARPTLTLVDPMCGSGTLLLEAAMIAADVAPGLMRIKCGVPGHRVPSVVRWKHSRRNDRDEEEDAMETWKLLLNDATAQTKRGLTRLRTSLSGDDAGGAIRFLGNDAHPGALELFESALARSGLDDGTAASRGQSPLFEIHNFDCRDWGVATATRGDADDDDEAPSRRRWVVVCNPPWGERLSDDMDESWESLRTFLRERCPPLTEAWILSGNAAATKHLGLRKSQSHAVRTGQHSLRWLQYIILGKTTLEQDPLDDQFDDKDGNNNIIDKVYAASADGKPARSVSPKRVVNAGARRGDSKQYRVVKERGQREPFQTRSKPKPSRKDRAPKTNEWLI